jgi:hypothetical protein
MTTTNLEVANEISKQIGRAAFTMIGAKNLIAIESGLQFKICTNSKRATHVRVTLDTSKDLYVVGTYRVRGANVEQLALESNVHVEALKRTIETLTGLYLSL